MRSARRRSGAVICIIALISSAATTAAAYPRPGRTELASLSSDGSQANHRSGAPVLDASGRFVAFESFASNLVAADTNGRWDVFLRDTISGTTELATVSGDGTGGDRDSSQFDMSADARRIAFRSPSTNLVSGDTNEESDIFVRDREEGTTVRVSVGTGGIEADWFSVHPRISGDGRIVAFRSLAANLVADDTNGSSDLFVHDLETGITERVSVSSDGTQAEGESFLADRSDLSGDGRFVVFESFASNLVTDDSNDAADVFVHDRATGTTERVSIAGDSSQGSGDSQNPSLSDDGRFIAFVSTAPNLVPNDNNGAADVFVHDRDTGQTRRVSVAGDGAEANGASVAPSISGDGDVVAFESSASNLVPGDTNGRSDIFVHDRISRSVRRASLDSAAGETDHDSVEPSLDRSGHAVAFTSWASNLVTADDNGFQDIFVREMGPNVGVGGLSIVPETGSISVSGWATFSGRGTSAVDPPDDGATGAEGAGAELTGAELVHRPESEDVVAIMMLSSAPGSPGTLYGARFTLDGLLYEIRAAQSADGPRFALFTCGSSCEKVADLTGAIGTTGDEVIVSVPSDALPGSASSLTDTSAFTAVGDVGSGAVSSFDSVALGDLGLVSPRVDLGIAPAGALEQDVSFGTEAPLTEGLFNGSLDTTSLASGAYDVWARACHGALCGTASQPVSVDGGSVARRTDLSFTARTDKTGQYSDQVTIGALLTDAGGAAMEGEPISVEIAGDESMRILSTTTDASGVASVTPILEERPGRYRITASFEGGEDVDGSSAATNLDVVREDSDVTLAVNQDQSSTVLTARLSDLDSPATGISQRDIEFSRADDVLGTSSTNEHGIATLEIGSSASAHARVTARFEGDDYYRSAADTVFPPVARTERVSVGAAGEGDEDSNTPSSGSGVSGSARLVAFHSLAGNLVPGDTNDQWDVFVHDLAERRTERISVSADGRQGDDDSFAPAMTPDGRYVSFWSSATNIVGGDSNGAFDVFVHDLESDTIERVSLAHDGAEGNGDSFGAGISDDGRYVLFGSDASNLVLGDNNGDRDVFVHDRETGSITRVSVASDGTEANLGSFAPALSADGRFVTFRSGATNLVEGDTNDSWDVFVHDLETGTTERASLTNNDSQSNGGSDQSAISADGRFVAFRSHASNLVPTDTPASYDVFVRDRVKGTTERISIGTNGEDPNSNSIDVAISDDGRYVSFTSFASNLVPDDRNSTGQLFSGDDVFVHDRVTRTTERVSVASDGDEAEDGSKIPSLSPDGRYVEFMSTAPDIVADDTNGFEDVFIRDRGPDAGIGALQAAVAEDTVTATGWTNFSGAVTATEDPPDDGAPGAASAGGELIGASLIHRPDAHDLLVRLDVTSMPSASSGGGAPGTLYGLSFTSDGVPYEIRATRTASGATFRLYRCVGSCVRVADLSGGIGTAGPEVLVSLPMDHLDDSTPTLTQVTAFTSLGDAGSGSFGSLDEVALPDSQLLAPEVLLGIAPAGTPPSEVSFTATASLTDGSFSGELDASGLAFGDYDLWAKGCQGTHCGAQSTPFTVVLPEVAEISFTEASDSSSQYSDVAVLQARLSQEDGSPLVGREVTFTLSGESSTRSFIGTTDDEGIVSVTSTITEKPGPYQLTVRYAGDERRGAAAAAIGFVVDKEDSHLELTAEGQGRNRTLTVRLVDADTPTDGIGSRSVDFYGDGELMGSATTGDDGVARLEAPPRYRGGKHNFEARFEGDDYYSPSSDGTSS